MVREDLLRTALSQQLKMVGQTCFSTAMLRWLRVEDHPAANGLHWRIAADDKSITGQRNRWFLKADLHVGCFTGSEFFAIQENDSSHDFAGTQMKSDARTVAEWPRCVGEMLQHSIQHERRSKLSGMAKDITTLQLYLVDALEINRRALTSDRLRNTGVMDLHTTDFGVDPFGVDLDPIFDPDRARKQGPSDDSAKTTNRKDTIDGES